MEKTLNNLSKIDTPVSDKILKFASDLLVVFKIIVEKLDLIPIIYQKFPKLEGLVNPELMTLILTVLIGMIITYSIFLILINVCKFTLNFLIFIKWTALIILVIGMIYNIL